MRYIVPILLGWLFTLWMLMDRLQHGPRTWDQLRFNVILAIVPAVFLCIAVYHLRRRMR